MSHRHFPHNQEHPAAGSKGVLLGQHFLVDRKLVSQLVRDSGIGSSDVVYEIGAGTGAITRDLAKRAGKVIAIEKDPRLYGLLCRGLSGLPNIELKFGDFRRFPVPAGGCKVFASIPFSMTAWIVRWIVGRFNGISDAWLIVQREAARKFCGDGRGSLFSALCGPWFEMGIVRDIPRESFRPVPSVAVVMLSIKRRIPPLLPGRHAHFYRKFVVFAFSGWCPSLRIRLGNIFSRTQWKRLSADLDFRPDAVPSEIRLEQWLGLFNYMLRGVPETKWRSVLGTLGGAGP